MSDKDTIEVAARTPEAKQPHKELGLTDDEYQKIRDILGRRPTAAELALYSVMWSEHCSYKSSKVHLRNLAPSEDQARYLLAGIGANAGVVDIGQGYAVTFKIESHNHPSFVEPHQGAATGIGGIVRDILAMGARPVAVMDALRFGPADAHDTARVLPGVVSGISFYGNCLGLPNIGGELAFDPSYVGNPLVNALCVGLMRHDDLKSAVATGAGNKVVLFGHSFGSLIAGLVTDRIPERIAHLVIIDGGIPQDGQSIFGRIPAEIVAKRQKLVQVVNGTEVLPFAPVGSLIIDDPALAASPRSAV